MFCAYVNVINHQLSMPVLHTAPVITPAKAQHFIALLQLRSNNGYDNGFDSTPFIGMSLWNKLRQRPSPYPCQGLPSSSAVADSQQTVPWPRQRRHFFISHLNWTFETNWWLKGCEHRSRNAALLNTPLTDVKARRSQLVLGGVTTREDRALCESVHRVNMHRRRRCKMNQPSNPERFSTRFYIWPTIHRRVY